MVYSSDQIPGHLLAQRCRRVQTREEALHMHHHVFYICSEMSTVTKGMNVLPTEKLFLKANAQAMLTAPIPDQLRKLSIIEHGQHLNRSLPHAFGTVRFVTYCQELPRPVFLKPSDCKCLSR